MRFSERPDTPAQAYAMAAGLFLVALGVLSLIFAGVEFGTVGPAAAQPEFLIWSVGGWTSVFWIAMGGLALFSAPRLDAARTYALIGGIIFAAAAVWGFIDGNDVVELLVADTTNNVTHAVLGALGLFTALLPRDAQRASDDGVRERRFDRAPAEQREPVGRR